MKESLVLVRHGQVEARYQGCYLGKLDAPLSIEGQRQASALGSRFSSLRFSAVFCSPLLRARQTMEALPFEADTLPDLREVDFGTWEGRSFDEISRDYPGAGKDWTKAGAAFTFPEGENVAAFLVRIGRVARRILAEKHESCLVVAHGGVIRAVICELLGLGSDFFSSFSVKYASVTSFEIRDGYPVMTGLNDTCHLDCGP